MTASEAIITGCYVYVLGSWVIVKPLLEPNHKSVKGMVDFFGLNLSVAIAMVIIPFAVLVGIADRLRRK